MRPKKIDRYGRTVARVIVDGADASLELVKAGLAWHYTQYSDDPELAKAEQAARSRGIGIWSLPNPIPPWGQQELKQNSIKIMKDLALSLSNTARWNFCRKWV